ncbi:hypothetical protein AAC387_Pa07g2531 [Persea americana]
MLSYARVLVNLDVATVSPSSIPVELEGDAVVDVKVLYENIPCADCLSTGHISSKCPLIAKPGLLSPPATAILQKNPSITVVIANAVSAKYHKMQKAPLN